MRSPAERGHAARVTEIGLLIALACVLGAVERVLSPTALVPGVRLGLANVAILVALMRYGPKAAGIVTLGKLLIIGFAFGTVIGPIGLISATGGIAAWGAMSALSGLDRFSMVGISIAGAAAHVVGQLSAAAVVTGSATVLSLLPVLLLASLPTGIAVGLLSRLLSSRISRPVLSAAEG